MTDLRHDPWTSDLAQFAATFDQHPDVQELHRRATAGQGTRADPTDLSALAAVYTDTPDHRRELVRSAREILQVPTRLMTRRRRILVGSYLAALAVALLPLSLWAWSVAARAVDAGETKSAWITLFGSRFAISSEYATVAIVAIMAMLGSVTVLLLTFCGRAGHETLERGYLWWYLSRPFSAAGLGLLFYLAVVAGFFDPSAADGRAALAVAAAVGGLAGLFTDQVIAKMRGILGQTAFAAAAEKDCDGEP